MSEMSRQRKKIQLLAAIDKRPYAWYNTSRLNKYKSNTEVSSVLGGEKGIRCKSGTIQSL